MKTLFKTVMAKLQTDMPELRYISEDWGQLDYYNDKPPVNWPCALISIASGQDTVKTKDLRNRSTTLQVRLADSPSVIATSGAPDTHVNTALLILDLVDKVGDSLHDLEVTGYKNELTQASFNKVIREDGVREYNLFFKIDRLK